VTDEMRLVIAFFACMMVVNIDDEVYDELVTILIYPHKMVMQDVHVNNGIYTQERFVLQGQSSGGVIVIAWDDAKKEAYHLRNHNVIIHELAHVLDFEQGMANGVPSLERSKYDAWSRVIYKRFNELHEKVEHNKNLKEYSLIGEYASTNEAEFFAVVSELFFQNPKSLKQHFPDLYNEFSTYYCLDPVSYM
ncbi:MAG: M90 family metallopeptidase, partial [Sulfurimonas sp.]|nr:M90 family metallopeptidase [Sulfurimonas sp.]